MKGYRHHHVVYESIPSRQYHKIKQDCATTALPIVQCTTKLPSVATKKRIASNSHVKSPTQMRTMVRPRLKPQSPSPALTNAYTLCVHQDAQLNRCVRHTDRDKDIHHCSKQARTAMVRGVHVQALYTCQMACTRTRTNAHARKHARASVLGVLHILGVRFRFKFCFGGGCRHSTTTYTGHLLWGDSHKSQAPARPLANLLHQHAITQLQGCFDIVYIFYFKDCLQSGAQGWEPLT
eukprot:5970748-Amphidinium_carterae.1